MLSSGSILPHGPLLPHYFGLNLSQGLGLERWKFKRPNFCLKKLHVYDANFCRFWQNGESPPTLLSIVWQSFDRCFHDGCSWWLITALFVYTQSFTYVILLTQSSMLAICTSCFGFPIIGIWWSIFQVNTHNWFVWMPVYTGELVCSVLGLPLILAGTVYLFKLDVLTSSNSNKNPTSGTQGKTLASTLQRHQHEQLRC